MAGLSLAGASLVAVQMWLASRLSDGSPGNAPDDEGLWGPQGDDPWQLVMVGDSTANGVGAQRPTQTIGSRCARRIAVVSGRPVQLVNVSENGATSSALPAQVERALERVPAADMVIIVIGGNDIATFADQTEAIAHLRAAVTRFREAGSQVVVATCPDFGMIVALGRPLRWIVQRRSRRLAALQTVAAVECGGRTVSLGSMITQAFLDDPDGMFHTDRFHPSAKGYKRAAQALVPTLLDALGIQPVGTGGNRPDRVRAASLEQAAFEAAEHPGTEVSAGGSGTEGPPSRSGAEKSEMVSVRIRHRPADPADDAGAAPPARR